MSLHEIFVALEASGLGVAIRESLVLFPWIESVHVLAVVVMIGAVIVMDLRLLGLGAHRSSARQLIAEVLPYTWGAFVVAAGSGFLLFASAASLYWTNIAFRLKLVGLLIAAMNMLVFHVATVHGIADWDERQRPPVAVRIAGMVSLSCWVFVVAAGRWIGFVD